MKMEILKHPPAVVEPWKESEWMTKKEAARYLRVSYNTINRGCTPWTSHAPPRGKFRYKLLIIRTSREPSLWAEDVQKRALVIPGERYR